jgi:putative transposase
MDSELDPVPHYGFCTDDLYHESRTHLSLEKQCPLRREVLKLGKIVTIPQLGGLHHRYERIAA